MGVHVQESGFIATPDPSVVTKERVLHEINKAFMDPDFDSVFLYYAGHGESLEGAWCFESGEMVGPDEVFKILEQSPSKDLFIVSDSCFSGKWVDAAKNLPTQEKKRLIVQASSQADGVSYDSPEGGEFTKRYLEANHHDIKFGWATAPGHIARALPFAYHWTRTNIFSSMSEICNYTFKNGNHFWRVKDGGEICTFYDWAEMCAGYN